MRTTLHALTKNCIDDSTSNKVQRPKWIDSWPSQIVLAVNQLFWTREVELAIKQSHTAGSFASLTMTPKGVHALLDKLNSQVRSAGGRSNEAGLFFFCVCGTTLYFGFKMQTNLCCRFTSCTPFVGSWRRW